MMMVSIVFVCAFYACNHAVKVTYEYEYDKGLVNVLTGKTEVRVLKTETKLITGKVINKTNRSIDIELDAEMLAFANKWMTTKIEFR